MNTNTLVDNIKKLQMLEQEMYNQLEMLHNKSCITTNSSQELEEESSQNLRCSKDQILPFEGKLTSNVESVNDCLLRCKNDKDCKGFSFFTTGYPGRCMLCKTNISESMDSDVKGKCPANNPYPYDGAGTDRGYCCDSSPYSTGAYGSKLDHCGGNVVKCENPPCDMGNNLIKTRTFNKVDKDNNQIDEKCSQEILKQQNDILNKIRELSEVRLDLFKKLQERHDDIKEDLDTDKDNLKSQIAMVNVVEEQINNVKSNIKAMKQDKNNRLRMIEIGNYEFKRYNVMKEIMRTLFIACLIVALTSVALQRGLLPSVVASSIIFVAFLVSAVLVFYKMYDLSTRRVDDFDKYNFVGLNGNTIEESGAYGSSDEYESVVEHDKKFFEKLISDTEGNLQSLEKSAVGEFHKDFKKAKTMGKQLEKEVEKKGKQGVKVLKTSVDVSKKGKKVEGFVGF